MCSEARSPKTARLLLLTPEMTAEESVPEPEREPLGE